jgi:methylmalonyl-CoA mutase N-terminal domain/subunit
MWAKIMRERFNAKDPRSWMLRFHTQTAGVTLQAQQPDVNVVRTTIQGLAAVLGGTQSLHVNSKDEALGLPTEDSATLALRTQQVLASESGVTEAVDPLAGSYYVEHLTNELERLANELIASIDAMGGAAAAIQRSYQQQLIEDSAYRHLELVESGERIIVGVNANVSTTESPVEVLRLDPGAERRQIERVQRVRTERDAAAVEHALGELASAAANDAVNTMPPILECVEAYATIGEICDTLRDAFGTYRSTI